jgi:dolichol-phosphate mannosyltransferase
MKTIVVIPTYDERDNVAPMAAAVLAQDQEIELLFVDDNSPDGTGDAVEALRANEPRLHCLHRTRKEGLGRAYVAGFRRALELGAERIVQMDCDFSHDPADLPRLIAVDADLVIGSRYVPGGATPGWPFKRRLISRAGGLFIRTVTGMPLRDPTGGFKCWRAATLAAIGFDTVESAGYSFQLEMNHRTWRAGRTIREIPIVFTDRVAGYSKITPGIALESVKIAWRLRRAGARARQKPQ